MGKFSIEQKLFKINMKMHLKLENSQKAKRIEQKQERTKNDEQDRKNRVFQTILIAHPNKKKDDS